MPNYGISGDKYQNDLIRLTKCAAHRLAHVEALAVMDAQQLALAEAFFDMVLAQDVITTVLDPERALDEIARVTRPGARSSWSPTSARRIACGVHSSRALHRSPGRLGWRPEFRWERLAQWAARDSLMCGSWRGAPCRPSAIFT
jgi:phosphatidylethanolamine/phosphatidyl-N-methylethanolamine N-methyltransferase